MSIDNQYTNTDYTGLNLSDRIDMDNLVIVGMCLSQPIPRNILPPNLTNITFVDCNLDNVILPVSATIIGSSNRMFKPQDDGLDWEIDADGNPTKILGT